VEGEAGDVQQRVEIIKALSRDARVLVLDEPTAVLTPQETDELMQIMRELAGSGPSIVFITHKLREIMTITDRVSVMRRGEVVATRETKATTVEELAELMVGRRVLLRVEKGPSRPGETVLDIAAGDTNRWMVSQTLTGTGETGRTLIIVKPLAARLKTNIVLATDRRAYLIEAVSVTGDTYTAQVAWSYPKPAVPEAPPPPPPPPPPVLNYGYDITPPWRKAPVWTPVSVWDDGRKTWIAFSSNVAAADMPPLFVRTGEGLELVNYRVEGQTYVVDRLFDRAELRLGQKKPIVVRIDRKEPARP
jgi:type IV secretory pathway VirB9-like protein